METLQAVAVASIALSKTNPRSRFDDDAMKELAESVRQVGVLVPVLVRPGKNGRGGYELVCGHRRLRAAQAVQLETIPAVVRELSDAEALELQLVENLQREGLDPLEAAACTGGCGWANAERTLCTRCAPPRRLSGEEYSEQLMRLRLVSALVAPLALREMLATIAFSDSVGSILDPTLYLHGAKRLDVVRDLVAATRTFQKAVEKFEREMLETDAAARRSLEILRRGADAAVQTSAPGHEALR